jgi:hypothetical protein
VARHTTALNTPLETPAGCYAIGMEQKTCKACGNTYDFTKEHFPKLENFCRVCVRNRNKLIREKAKARRLRAMQKIEDAGAALFADVAIEGGSNIPHSAEVIERVFQYFGGVGGFSAMLVKQYYDSAPGSSARNRLIETIVRLVTKNVEVGGVKKPLTLWTEEELEAELEQRFKQALKTYNGAIINAEPQALPAPEDGSTDDTDPSEPESDAVPEGRTEDPAIGTPGAEAGGSEAVPPDPDPGPDSRLHGP